MGVGKGALLRESGLAALLERSAISDAAKDSGNELRIILVAEAVEELIFVVDVEINASIEGVAVFVQLGRIRVVRDEIRSSAKDTDSSTRSRSGRDDLRGADSIRNLPD